MYGRQVVVDNKPGGAKRGRSCLYRFPDQNFPRVNVKDRHPALALANGSRTTILCTAVTVAVYMPFAIERGLPTPHMRGSRYSEKMK
jgi:hypothetical protein